jgi:hypothetical protein
VSLRGVAQRSEATPRNDAQFLVFLLRELIAPNLFDQIELLLYYSISSIEPEMLYSCSGRRNYHESVINGNAGLAWQ